MIILPCGKYRANAHCYGLCRNIFQAEKITGSIESGHPIEAYHPGNTAQRGARFVKADVARTPNTQNLNIEPPGFSNFFFEALAKVADIFFFLCPVGNVNVFCRDIDVVKEMLPHKAHITVYRVRLHRIILIQIKGDDVFKTQALFFVEVHQEIVESGRCRPCSEAQYHIFTFFLPGTNQGFYFPGGIEGSRFGVFVYAGAYFFKLKSLFLLGIG